MCVSKSWDFSTFEVKGERQMKFRREPETQRNRRRCEDQTWNRFQFTRRVIQPETEFAKAAFPSCVGCLNKGSTFWARQQQVRYLLQHSSGRKTPVVRQSSVVDHWYFPKPWLYFPCWRKSQTRMVYSSGSQCRRFSHTLQRCFVSHRMALHFPNRHLPQQDAAKNKTIAGGGGKGILLPVLILWTQHQETTNKKVRVMKELQFKHGYQGAACASA